MQYPKNIPQRQNLFSDEIEQKQNETQEPQIKDKNIKILILVLTLFAIIIFFAYKLFRKIRNKKYGY